ncbi:zwei Ig domain protein zig-8 isoform X1 [Procambarus clarkii]|uniref:zwei Ig domain protein zig-8 isoform X1 n=1 Tax=Procambarus clarkii TaxID=6728 RepID=UPI001E677E4C|nr:uncharacterized protein LOC123751291 [Procambarus clarkii]
METLRASVWRLSVLLTILGGVEAETLPTLTLQPLNYFTLPPPASTPAPSSPASFTTDLPDAPSETSTGQEDSQEDTGGEEAKEAVREPYFATPNTSVSVYLGAEVTLDCTLHDTANQSVSWLRSVDDMLVLLTWDSHIYSNDHRYSLVQAAGDRWQQWQLVIRDAQLDDQGQYRCQLATEPPMTLAITLNVIAPRARLVDERGTEVLEKHYKSGSMIELMCLIEQVPFPHGPVTWRRGTTVLTYNTSRGGISMKGDPGAGYIRSRLYVADAAPSDSGLYSCWYANHTSDTVAVHVLAGENSAAMQHDALPETSSSATPASNASATCHTCFTQHLYLLAASCLATCTATCRSVTMSSSLTSSASSWMAATAASWKILTVALASCRNLAKAWIGAVWQAVPSWIFEGPRTWMAESLVVGITTCQGLCLRVFKWLAALFTRVDRWRLLEGHLASITYRGSSSRHDRRRKFLTR